MNIRADVSDRIRLLLEELDGMCTDNRYDREQISRLVAGNLMTHFTIRRKKNIKDSTDDKAQE